MNCCCCLRQHFHTDCVQAAAVAQKLSAITENQILSQYYDREAHVMLFVSSNQTRANNSIHKGRAINHRPVRCRRSVIRSSASRRASKTVSGCLGTGL